MVWIEEDPEDHLVPLPWHEQGHLPLDQVAQIYIKNSFVTSIHPVLLDYFSNFNRKKYL